MDLYHEAATLGLEGTVELLRWKSDAEPRLSALEVDLQSHKVRVAELERQLGWFRNQLFGASSERRILNALAPGDQLWLGEQMLKPAEEPPPPSTSVKAYERIQRDKPTEFVEPDSRLKFDDTIPVEVVEVPNPALEGLSEDEYELVEERATYRLAQREGPYVVLKFIQKVAKIKNEEGLSYPAMPPAVFHRSFADVSLLAGLVVDKFQYHLPLYRQYQRLQQAGVHLHRSTLTRLVHRTAELFEPIYAAILSSVVGSNVLVVDESPTPAGRANGKMKKGFYWALYGDQDEVAFIFSPTRGRSVIDEALSTFAGTLVSDGYIAYESFNKATVDVVHAQCWAHARRKFIEAEAGAPMKCQKVLQLLQKVYEIESRARGKPNKLERLRDKESRPLIEALFEYLEAELASTALLPSNSFVAAAEYATKRKHELKIFLDNPEVPIDTNQVERTLRGPAVGRKNWMFHVTEVGARYGAILYTLVQSCILSGVRPSEYFIDILQRIDFHPADQVQLLTPRLWKENFSETPLRSVLQR